MNKKTILIGLGVLAVAGIGYYMWNKNQSTTTSKFSGACGCSGADGSDEDSSSITAGGKACDCQQGYMYNYDANGKATSWVKDRNNKNVACTCSNTAE